MCLLLRLDINRFMCFGQDNYFSPSIGLPIDGLFRHNKQKFFLCLQTNQLAGSVANLWQTECRSVTLFRDKFGLIYGQILHVKIGNKK